MCLNFTANCPKWVNYIAFGILKPTEVCPPKRTNWNTNDIVLSSRINLGKLKAFFTGKLAVVTEKLHTGFADDVKDQYKFNSVCHRFWSVNIILPFYEFCLLQRVLWSVRYDLEKSGLYL